jgi:hypothetical protein
VKLNKLFRFEIGEEAILNKKAKTGLPNRVGEKVQIINKLNNVMYDYEVKFGDGDTTKVKESELTKIIGSDKPNKPLYKVGDKVVSISGYEGYIGTVMDIDEFEDLPYGYGVKFEGFDTVNWFYENQIERYDENKHKKGKGKNDVLAEVFTSLLKDKSDTVTLPKSTFEKLINLIMKESD